MENKHKGFFVELAQVFKKYQCTAAFGSKLPICWVENDRVIGTDKIVEAWIDRDGEAILRVKSEQPNGFKQEFEIYSDGRVG